MKSKNIIIILSTLISLFSCGIDAEVDNPTVFGLGESAAIGFSDDEGFLADMEYQECKATVNNDVVTVRQIFKISPRANKSITLLEDDFHLFFGYEAREAGDVGHLCNPDLIKENNSINFLNHPISIDMTIFVYYTAERVNDVDYDTVGITLYLFSEWNYTFVNR